MQTSANPHSKRVKFLLSVCLTNFRDLSTEKQFHSDLVQTLICIRFQKILRKRKKKNRQILSYLFYDIFFLESSGIHFDLGPCPRERHADPSPSAPKSGQLFFVPKYAQCYETHETKNVSSFLFFRSTRFEVSEIFAIMIQKHQPAIPANQPARGIKSKTSQSLEVDRHRW